METRANYVLIGAFTLAAAAFMLLFGLWAAKYTSDKDWRHYDVIFDEAVTGLTEGGSVQYNGISVGSVDDLRLDPDDPRKVIARVKLRAETPVKTDTHAKLSFTGLTGTAFIQLTGGSPEAPLLASENGDDVPLIQTEASALQNIAETANKLVTRLDKVLSEDNIRNITDTLKNLVVNLKHPDGTVEPLAIGIPGDRDVDMKRLEKSIGITLTESHMMQPAASVCGYYFANPDSHYFSIGKIGDDQLADFAKRKEISIDQARKRTGMLV